MERMSGVQLANKLKEVTKDVQIFLMSAFEFNEDHHSDLKELDLKEFRK
jgi:two-component SAPR family response regulator